jgi:hypothetical protein
MSKRGNPKLSGRMIIVLLNCSLAAAPFETSALAEEGVWSADSQFAQVNVACSRRYTCGPGRDILHSGDTKIVSTAPKLVWGVCSVGAGPVDSCNVCNTNPPTEKCEWSLQKK